MCGIAGIVDFGQPPTRETIARMTDLIRHRGPDDEGIALLGPAGLGHRRLAIIDLSPAGHQPMTFEEAGLTVTFNGEIYNYQDVKAELEARGDTFRSRSDTEVILHAYRAWGVDCLAKLNGMFAFAIWDAGRQALFAARDRLGKKPFFYTVADGVLHFASELPALRLTPGWRGDVDLTALEGYLSLGYFLAPSTAYRNVFKLPPGHWL
ncbi:MAG TPA: hypothetical protein VN539_04305, partial [Candidatus Saccharimonadales bacterium]|nr:hypothetical protein [Candidatus Saccharimonadales bacterium]